MQGLNYILGKTRRWQVNELIEECGAVGQALSPPVAAASMYRATLPLDAKQVASFHENGFVVHPAISTASEAARLHCLLDRLLKSKAGIREGTQFDMLNGDDLRAPGSSVQICDPENFEPRLRHTLFGTNALAIAKQLLGPRAQPIFSHAIFKPAHYGAPTPWHQDDAFHADFEYPQISLWMPLQNVTATNGCMQFIPGSHRGELLAHRCYNNDPHANALECFAELDLSNAVACPLLAGGCTIHTGRTLHYAGGNETNAGRWAYILAFYLPPRRRRVHAVPWLELTRTAKMARRRAWLRRGGFLVHWWRTEFSNRLRRALVG